MLLYRDRQGDLFDEEETLRINAFDWQDEFSTIFSGKNPGFDAVIGNPPYLNAVEERIRFVEIVSSYLRASFVSARGTYDGSVLFQELGLPLLLDGGRTSFIVPNKFLSAPFGVGIREYLSNNSTIKLIADYSKANVFKGVGVYPVVYVAERKKQTESSSIIIEIYAKSESGPFCTSARQISDDLGTFKTWSQAFSLGTELLDKICQIAQKLSEVYEITASAAAGEAYKLKECVTDGQTSKTDFAFVTSGLIDRYTHSHGLKKARYLKSDYNAPFLSDSCPNLSPQRRKQYRTEKIIVAGMTKRLEAIWDCGVIAGTVPTIQIFRKPDSPYSLKFVLGIFNSRLIDWIFRQYFDSLSLAGGYLRIGVPQVGDIPLIRGYKNTVHVKDIEALTQQMIDTLSRHSKTKTAHDRTAIERQIAATDREIDQLVYELYGLTEKEIALVEEGTK